MHDVVEPTVQIAWPGVVQLHLPVASHAAPGEQVPPSTPVQIPPQPSAPPHVG